MKVWCNLTAEQASLYQAVVDDMLARIEAAERDRAPRPGAGHDDQAQAGLQPPGALARRRLPAARPLRQAGPAGGDLRGGRRGRRQGALSSPSSPRSARCCSPTWPRGSAARCCTCTAARPKTAAGRDGRAVPERRRSRPLFLLSLKAGGTGLNLTAANHVIHFDRWWNPAVEDQATDRAFRIGQRRNVQVHKFVCVGHAGGEDRRDDRARRRRSPSGSSAPARAG